jgi:hypothetical protein
MLDLRHVVDDHLLDLLAPAALLGRLEDDRSRRIDHGLALVV